MTTNTPMVLLTGAAGFIGSRLANALLAQGFAVRAVDCFTPYYNLETKRSNVDSFRNSPGCQFVDADLRTDNLVDLLDGVEVIVHQAAQPGVRASWAHTFSLYTEHNILATQRLLEAARRRPVRRFIYASSSSVYGQAANYPTSEDTPPRPHSPYGVTKLAAEQLCALYAANWEIPTVMLRYFTVYGARQRPDMALHRLIDGALDDRPFPRYGDGSQVRDFTHVLDVVAANIAAATVPDLPPASVINIAGGSSISLSDLIDLTGELVGRRITVEQQPAQAGDVLRTGATTDRAANLLGWTPEVALREGLTEQIEWQRHRRSAG